MLHFPPAFPDETIFSRLCRFKKELGAKGNLKFERILGKRNYVSDPDFPVGLRLLEDRTDTNWFCAEEAVSQHTILPYYRPFNSDENYAAWREGVLAGTGARQSMGLLVMPKGLKACPLCIANDTTEWGQPYFHLSHQISGAEACHIHGVRLEAKVMGSRDKLAYTTLADQKSRFEVPACAVHEVWVRLAKDLHDILTVFPARGCVNFYYYVSGCIRALKSDISRKNWPSLVGDYLKVAAQEVSPRLLRRLVWDKEDSICGNKTNFPASYLILIRACGLTPEAIANFRPTPPTPSRQKWPCLNRICTHALEKVMTLQKVFYVLYKSPDAQTGECLILRCPHCGRTTFQHGYRTSYRAINTRTLDFGAAWTEKFRLLWLDPTVTYKSLEKQLGLNPASIVPFHAAYLTGLPLDRNTPVLRAKRLSQYLVKKQRNIHFERAMLEWSKCDQPGKG